MLAFHPFFLVFSMIHLSPSIQAKGALSMFIHIITSFQTLCVILHSKKTWLIDSSSPLHKLHILSVISPNRLSLSFVANFPWLVVIIALGLALFYFMMPCQSTQTSSCKIALYMLLVLNLAVCMLSCHANCGCTISTLWFKMF